MIRQLDILRVGRRIAMTTMRKMKRQQKVDINAVFQRLALVRAAAKEVQGVLGTMIVSTGAQRRKRVQYDTDERPTSEPHIR